MAAANGNGATPPWLPFGDPPPAPKTARGTKVQLADGHEWLVPALSFYDLQQGIAVVDAAFANINWTNAEAREAAVDLIHLALVRNYPGLPREALYERLDFEATADALKVIWVQNGMKVRDLLTRMGLDPPDGLASPMLTANPPAPTG